MSAATDRVIATWSARGRPLPVPSAATHVWEQGTGEPVVCLHGVPASAFLYRHVLDELAARGRRAIAFDLPGMGLAQRPRDFDYSWSGLSAWALAAVDALELDRFHLVVHDVGGPVGFDLVRRTPGRIASLTVLNTFPRVASFRRPWVMEPMAWRGVGELAMATLRPRPFELLMRRLAVSSAVPAADLRAYVPLLKRGDGGRAFLRIMRGFERTEDFECGILGALAAREFPAQVLWGEHDGLLTAEEHGEHAREALGLEEIVLLPGSHFVQEDAPAEIAERVASL